MSSGEKKIIVSFILEVIGRPKEHLVQTLEEMIAKIDAEEKASVKNKKIHEPTVMKDQQDLFATFAEVEIEVEEAIFLAILMFKYMPAHVEIVSPEKMVFQNNQFADILNELTRRLHGYDELARIFQIEKNKMLEKIQELNSQIESKEKPKPSKKKPKKK